MTEELIKTYITYMHVYTLINRVNTLKFCLFFFQTLSKIRLEIKAFGITNPLVCG